MSKLNQKIDDEIAKLETTIKSYRDETAGTIVKFIKYLEQNVQTLHAFKAFVEDAMEDLDEESFSEYEQNALAVWEDE